MDTVVTRAGAATKSPSSGQFSDQFLFMKLHPVTAAVFVLVSYEGYSTPQAPPQQSAGGLQVDFESVFGAKASGSNSLNSDGEKFSFTFQRKVQKVSVT